MDKLQPPLLLPNFCQNSKSSIAEQAQKLVKKCWQKCLWVWQLKLLARDLYNILIAHMLS